MRQPIRIDLYKSLYRLGDDNIAESCVQDTCQLLWSQCKRSPGSRIPWILSITFTINMLLYNFNSVQSTVFSVSVLCRAYFLPISWSVLLG